MVACDCAAADNPESVSLKAVMTGLGAKYGVNVKATWWAEKKDAIREMALALIKQDDGEWGCRCSYL